MPSAFTVQPALCLDLDGTIRTGRNSRFIDRAEDILLFPDVEPVLWAYRNDGFLILGLTNQGGVAFGFKTLEQVQEEIDATLALFAHNPFHSVQASVLHPGGSRAPFNRRSLLRKPAYGMLAAFEADCFQHGIIIDWDASLFVGDRPEDEACARQAGIRFAWAADFFKRTSPPLGGSFSG